MSLVAMITPDWSECWTPAQAEAELEGFKFTGPGWYIAEDHTLLVVRAEGVSFQGKCTAEEQFVFASYTENPCKAFNAIVNAPVRVDKYE